MSGLFLYIRFYEISMTENWSQIRMKICELHLTIKNK